MLPWRWRVVKPPFRTKTLATKVSEEEFAQLEAAASERRQTLSEWCRETLSSADIGAADFSSLSISVRVSGFVAAAGERERPGAGGRCGLFQSETTVFAQAGYDDMFHAPTGSTTTGQARFYEGLQLPATFVPGFTNPDTAPAGILPATTIDPQLSTVNATPPVNRTWVAPVPLNP